MLSRGLDRRCAVVCIFVHLRTERAVIKSIDKDSFRLLDHLFEFLQVLIYILCALEGKVSSFAFEDDVGYRAGFDIRVREALKV